MDQCMRVGFLLLGLGIFCLREDGDLQARAGTSLASQTAAEANTGQDAYQISQWPLGGAHGGPDCRRHGRFWLRTTRPEWRVAAGSVPTASSRTKQMPTSVPNVGRIGRVHGTDQGRNGPTPAKQRRSPHADRGRRGADRKGREKTTPLQGRCRQERGEARTSSGVPMRLPQRRPRTSTSYHRRPRRTCRPCPSRPPSRAHRTQRSGRSWRPSWLP